MYVQNISQRIADLLQSEHLVAKVHSLFANACNLVTPEGEYFALVTSPVGPGPLNAVLGRGQTLRALQGGSVVTGNGRSIRLAADCLMDMTRAVVWNPRPDYEGLSTEPAVLAQNLTAVRRRVMQAAPPASLASNRQGPPGHAWTSFRARARKLIANLRQAHQQGDAAALLNHARGLVGLGPGLTPAGDDWLSGWVVGLRSWESLQQGTPFARAIPLQEVVVLVLQAAEGRTNALSLAFLRAAGDGQVSQAWHGLLSALGDRDPQPVRHWTDKVLQFGATSGFDMLAGFLAGMAPAPIIQSC